MCGVKSDTVIAFERRAASAAPRRSPTRAHGQRRVQAAGRGQQDSCSDAAARASRGARATTERVGGRWGAA
jgi:hypothetical protein